MASEPVNEPGFDLGALLDLSFQRFITISVIKIVYIIGIALFALGALAAIIAGFTQGFLAGIGGLVVVPIVFVLYVLFFRIYCELIVVLFRIAQNTSIMAGRGGELTTPGASPPPTEPMD